MSESAIKVENLSKIYKLYDNPLDRLKESLHPFKKTYHKDFYALHNVNFEVKKGETIGVIGKNGCGKSTLLKIITGVLTPASGTVSVNGKISALLELGTGFNPEFTGIENIYFSGTIMGYDKKEIDMKLDDILSFADIGEFVYQPIKIYSSGMFVRLAFAVAISVEPDILIIDEALAVGDISFQQKCFRRINDMKKKCTILFVSHDLGVVMNLCDSAIWLENGSIEASGDTATVIKHFGAFITQGFKINEEYTLSKSTLSNDRDKYKSTVIPPLRNGVSSFGEGGAKIVGVALRDRNSDRDIDVLYGKENIRLIIKISVLQDILNPGIGFLVTDRLGNGIFGSNTYILNYNLPRLISGDSFTVNFCFKWPLIHSNHYLIAVAVSDGTQEHHVQHHYVYDALVIENVADVTLGKSGGLLLIDDINFDVLDKGLG